MCTNICSSPPTVYSLFSLSLYILFIKLVVDCVMSVLSHKESLHQKHSYKGVQLESAAYEQTSTSISLMTFFKYYLFYLCIRNSFKFVFLKVIIFYSCKSIIHRYMQFQYVWIIIYI